MKEHELILDHGKTTEQLDELCWQRFTAWKAHERPLYRTKWFDYRFMSPLDATLKYVAEFARVYRDTVEREVDRERAKVVRLPQPQDFFLPDRAPVMLAGTKIKAKTFGDYAAHFTGCWRGRQIADGLGMPYGVYIRLAMRERLRGWQQRFLPRPMQLYSVEICERVQALWEEEQSARLYVASHPNYRAERYAGHIMQDDHFDWLTKQAYLRGNPTEWLRTFEQQGLLPV